MPLTLPAGLIGPDQWDEFVANAKAALSHTLADGEVPAFLGEPMTEDEALAYLTDWLDRNKVTLLEGGTDFLAAIARRFVVGDGPDEPIEEFEASLVSLTDEQLVALTEAEAEEVEALKRDVIDRRRELVADALAVGKQLLRGAVSSALYAAMGAS